MSHKDDYLEGEIQVLSQKIPKKIKFMGDTALMNGEEREIIGFIDAFAKLFNDNSFSEFREPMIIIGWSRWERTELTNLGFAIGDPTQRQSLGKTSLKDLKDLK